EQRRRRPVRRGRGQGRYGPDGLLRWSAARAAGASSRRRGQRHAGRVCTGGVDLTTVLLSRAMPRDALEALEGRARVRVLRESTEAALCEAIADVDALILGTNVRVTREVLARAQRLRIISRTGVGVDNV